MAIDLQPATNPLDIPSPKPSAIVRHWPDKMWCHDDSKRIEGDGSISFCAIGILGETGGFEWGEHDRCTLGLTRRWNGYTYSPVSVFVAEKYNLTSDQIIAIYDANDLCGKEAAADQLESLGL